MAGGGDGVAGLPRKIISARAMFGFSMADEARFEKIVLPGLVAFLWPRRFPPFRC